MTKQYILNTLKIVIKLLDCNYKITSSRIDSLICELEITTESDNCNNTNITLIILQRLQAEMLVDYETVLSRFVGSTTANGRLEDCLNNITEWVEYHKLQELIDEYKRLNE